MEAVGEWQSWLRCRGKGAGGVLAGQIEDLFQYSVMREDRRNSKEYIHLLGQVSLWILKTGFLFSLLILVLFYLLFHCEMGLSRIFVVESVKNYASVALVLIQLKFALFFFQAWKNRQKTDFLIFLMVPKKPTKRLALFLPQTRHKIMFCWYNETFFFIYIWVYQNFLHL